MYHLLDVASTVHITKGLFATYENPTEHVLPVLILLAVKLSLESSHVAPDVLAPFHLPKPSW